MSVLDWTELGECGEACPAAWRLTREIDLALILSIDLNYNNDGEGAGGRHIFNLIINRMQPSTEEKMAAMHSKHRREELSTVFRENRISAVLALTRQTIDDLVKQPPQQSR